MLPARQPPAQRHGQQDAGDVAEPFHHDVVGDPLAGLRVVKAPRARGDEAVADRLDVVVQVEAERGALVSALVEDALVGLAGLLAVVLQVRGRRQPVDGPHRVDPLPRHPVALLLRRQLLLRLPLAQLRQLRGVGRLGAQLQERHGGALLPSRIRLAQEGAQAAEGLVGRLGEALPLGLGVVPRPFRGEALGPAGDGARGALHLPGDGGPRQAAGAQFGRCRDEGVQVLRHRVSPRMKLIGVGRRIAKARVTE
jgi:hypothetical protein